MTQNSKSDSKSCKDCAHCVRVDYTFSGIRGDDMLTEHYTSREHVHCCTFNPPSSEGGFFLDTDVWESYTPKSIEKYFGYPEVDRSAPCGQFKRRRRE